MFVYDKAHDLAKDLQQSDEYKEYIRLKKLVMEDEQTKPLLADYKKLQLEAQASMLSGGQPSEETMNKIKKLGEVLQFKPEVSAFFAAEYKFQTMISDIYRIIGDACDLGLDFLKE